MAIPGTRRIDRRHRVGRKVAALRFGVKYRLTASSSGQYSLPLPIDGTAGKAHLPDYIREVMHSCLTASPGTWTLDRTLSDEPGVPARDRGREGCVARSVGEEARRHAGAAARRSRWQRSRNADPERCGGRTPLFHPARIVWLVRPPVHHRRSRYPARSTGADGCSLRSGYNLPTTLAAAFDSTASA